MKIKKIITAFMSLSLIGGVLLADNNTFSRVSTEVMAADEEEQEFTQGVYEKFTYNKYEDHIRIIWCESSDESLEIPAQIENLPVTEIGSYAFNNANCKFKSVKIPDSVTTICGMAFFGCTNLESVEIPDSVTYLDGGAFHGCVNLSSVTFSKNINGIEAGMFVGCINIKSITVPENITYINSAAFLMNYDDNYNADGNLESIIIKNPNCKIEDAPSTISNSISEPYFTGTIYGYPNSTAQEYAEKYGYKFESISEDLLGDIDGDRTINALDASYALMEYAAIATGRASTLSDSQKRSADVNADGTVDAMDASLILGYYAYTATGGTASISEYLSK